MGIDDAMMIVEPSTLVRNDGQRGTRCCISREGNLPSPDHEVRGVVCRKRQERNQKARLCYSQLKSSLARLGS
jgi:hypothetical protein